ncbi:putative beta-lactamase-like 1 [Onygenales sp. PD_12]|nr:putative beta-lactamase-like 1 [Onygenales sp. PD_12]
MHSYVLTLLLFLHHSLAAYCPPTGPVLPPPTIPANFAASELTDTLTGLIKNSQAYGWNASANSFSVSLTSADSTFFSYHHTAPLKNDSGVVEVAGDTIYRIASATKVFTVLAVLLEERIYLDDPIGKYVKELNGSEWEEVTVRLLTNQLAAVPRDGYAFDRASMSDELIPLGFPPLSPSDIPECGTGIGQRLCTREEWIEFLESFHGFTDQIGNRVAYSDIAYSILGYALEDLTGLRFEEVLKKTILGPLGLDDTGTTPPPVERGILPLNSGAWFELDLEYINPTAGLFSTPNNLATFLRGLLNHTLLSQTRTNEWLKPASFTSQLDESVGAPWEIFRPTAFTAPPRPIDHYTKSGDLPGFSSSYIVLVPEYNLGVTLISAGADASDIVALLLDNVQGTLIPLLENLAREQAAEIYAGDYQSKSKADNASATMSLVVDDGPGLKVAKWTNRDKNMLKTFYEAIFGSSKSGGDGIEEVDARFYPLGVDDRWRIVFTKPEGKEEGGKGKGEGNNGEIYNALRGSACLSWMKVDNFHYGKVAIDEVVFRMGGDGGRVVEGVDIPGLRAELDRI